MSQPKDTMSYCFTAPNAMNESFHLDIRGKKANLFLVKKKDTICLIADEWNSEIVFLLNEMIEKLQRHE